MVNIDPRGLHHHPAHTTPCANGDFDCAGGITEGPDASGGVKAFCFAATFTCGLADGPMIVVDAVCSAGAYSACVNFMENGLSGNDPPQFSSSCPNPHQ